MRQLAHALLAGIIASNPRMTAPAKEQDPNAGHAVGTSENALLVGHPIGTGDSYAIETGMLARVTDVRYAPGEAALPAIQPPVELPKPIFGGFDEEIAAATHAALSLDDAASRRLHRALDWYRIALSNAEAVTLDVRVGAARSAFEVLTDASDETKRLVRSYGALVRDQHTTKATYPHVFWVRGQGPAELTSDEWWMTRLCQLRNKIVHGEEVPDALWEHEGQPQLNHIHDRLIGAMQAVVAERSGDPALRLPKGERVFDRMADAFARHARLLGEQRDAN